MVICMYVYVWLYKNNLLVLKRYERTNTFELEGFEKMPLWVQLWVHCCTLGIGIRIEERIGEVQIVEQVSIVKTNSNKCQKPSKSKNKDSKKKWWDQQYRTPLWAPPSNVFLL